MSTTYSKALQTCIDFFTQKGQDIYNPEFNIYPEDYEILCILLAYFTGDEATAETYNISLRKGILLTGPVGCGKTCLMSLFRFYLNSPQRYIIKSCREVSFEFIREGYSTIQKYSRGSFNNHLPKIYCFDDLGTENNLKYYGNDCNVMAEILLSRYDLFISHGMLTHITTNLNSSDIENIYGSRLRSRFREQFNLISFDRSSKDKRI